MQMHTHSWRALDWDWAWPAEGREPRDVIYVRCKVFHNFFLHFASLDFILPSVFPPYSSGFFFLIFWVQWTEVQKMTMTMEEGRRNPVGWCTSWGRCERRKNSLNLSKEKPSAWKFPLRKMVASVASDRESSTLARRFSFCNSALEKLITVAAPLGGIMRAINRKLRQRDQIKSEGSAKRRWP